MNINNELCHYGIPGMRWGVRKASKSKGQNDSDDAKEARRIKKKKVNEMSNKELETLNKRQELEQKHKKFNPSTIAKGLAIAGAVALAIGTINNLYNNSRQAINNGKEVSKKYKYYQTTAKRKKQNQQLGKGTVNKYSSSKISSISSKNNGTRKLFTSSKKR